MYHATVHDARNNTLILVVQSQRYALHGATEETVAAIAVETSVSETIRNPPLAEAQNAVGKQKNYDQERFSIWWPCAVLNFMGLIIQKPV